ncbi:arylesterase [Desulfobaculum senezii]|jgi:acyl-CoA thioesterase-1
MKQERHLTVLAFGDSITSGWGIGLGASFPSLLEARLRDEAKLELTMRNAGIPGDTTRGGLGRLPAALFSRPDCAILALGVNDVFHEVPPESLEANLRRMLELFAEAEVPVLFVGVRALGVVDPDYAEDFNAVYPRLAREFGVEFYPSLLAGVEGVPEMNQPDGVHPSEAGARRIAEGMYPSLLRVLDTCWKV